MVSEKSVSKNSSIFRVREQTPNPADTRYKRKRNEWKETSEYINRHCLYWIVIWQHFAVVNSTQHISLVAVRSWMYEKYEDEKLRVWFCSIFVDVYSYTERLPSPAPPPLIYKILIDLQSGSILATYEKGRQNRSAWCTNCRHVLCYYKDSSSAEMWWMAFSLHAFASVDQAEGENVQRLSLFSWL